MVIKRRVNGIIKDSVNFSISSIKNNQYLQNKTFNYIILTIFIIPIVLFLLLKDNSLPVDVYLIPHSHIEIGDLDSNQVYNKTSIILDNIIEELKNDKNKTFNWAEVNNFSKWYNLKNQNEKEVVNKLIKNQQFEFISGGWVQNEESIANVDGILEQMTQGHMWLKDTFNITVEYGWQIDSIGHSSIIPTLFSQMGIKGLVINRISESIKDYLKKWKEMEFLWRGSDTLGKQSELIVSLLNDGYSSPNSLDPFKKHSKSQRVSDFVYYLKQQSKGVKSNILLVPIGGNYAFLANSEGENEFTITNQVIEKLLKHKESYKIKSIQYSTLSKYFNEIKKYYQYNEDDQHITLFNKEFLPYKNEEKNQYYTGYYSTLPILKKVIRDNQYLLRNVESLYTLASIETKSSNYNPLNQLQDQISNIRNNLSLIQDHSIITGTNSITSIKSSLSNLQNQRIESLNLLSNSFEFLLNKNNNSNNNDNQEEPFNLENVIDLDNLKSNELYSVVFHNSLGWESSHHISIRVKSSNKNIVKKLQLIDSITMEATTIQAIKIQTGLLECFSSSASSEHYSIYSIIKVPALGVKTYFLKVNKDDQDQDILSKELILDDKVKVTTISLSSTLLEFTFDKYGMLQSISNSDRREVKNVKQYFTQYKTKKGNQFVFKASKQKENILVKPDQMIHYDGPLVSQLTLIYGDGSGNCNRYSVVHHRTFKRVEERGKTYTINERYLETSYSFVGEVNTEKTINIQVETIPNSQKVFYTDNGIESRKRILATKKGFFGNEILLPSESSYYPAINYVKVKDQTYLPKISDKDIKNSRYRNEQYTVYLDRTLGTSFKDGTLEIMLHRSVGNNDQSRIDGKLYLNFDSIETQKQVEKKISLQIQNPPIYMYKKISNNINSYKDQYIQIYSPLLKDLPQDIHLQSFKTFSNNKVGLRLLNINNNDFDSHKIIKSNEFRIFELLKLVDIKETTLLFNNINKNSIGLYSTLEGHYPIISGEPEYSNIIKSKNKLIFKHDNDKFTITQLEFKSFIIEFQDQLNQKVTNQIQLNSNYLNSEEETYLYDFSILPTSLTISQDNNNNNNNISDFNDEDIDQDNSNLLTFMILFIICLIIYLAYRKKSIPKSD